MMHAAGTSSLQAYRCPGRHNFHPIQKCSHSSRSSRTQRTCVASFMDDAFQAEVDIPTNEVPDEDVWKQFKNESRRSSSHNELRRRKQFEDHQDYLKRKIRQTHQNRKMQRFDKFLPRLESTQEEHIGATFTDVFADQVDDILGSGDFGSEDFASGSFDFGSQDFGSQDFGSQDFGSQDFPSDFGPGPLYGMSASPFLRRVDPQEIGNQGETPIGRWGSRKPSETPPAPRTPVRNDAEQPLTARARKAAQALNAQAKQSTAAPGQGITAKNQPKQQQRVAPSNNGAGRTANLPINGSGGKAGATTTPPKGQAPAPRKRWQTQRQKRTRAPGSAAVDQAQARQPAAGAPVQTKEPANV